MSIYTYEGLRRPTKAYMVNGYKFNSSPCMCGTARACVGGVLAFLSTSKTISFKLHYSCSLQNDLLLFRSKMNCCVNVVHCLQFESPPAAH